MPPLSWGVLDQHLLVPNWSRLPTELGPVRHIDIARHAAGLGPFCGHRVGASRAARDDTDDASLAEQRRLDALRRLQTPIPTKADAIREVL
jgi:hypothetical protein